MITVVFTMIFTGTPNILLVTSMVFLDMYHGSNLRFQKYHGTTMVHEFQYQITFPSTIVYHGKIMVLDGNTMVLYDCQRIYHDIYCYSKYISSYHSILVVPCTSKNAIVLPWYMNFISKYISKHHSISRYWM